MKQVFCCFFLLPQDTTGTCDFCLDWTRSQAFLSVSSKSLLSFSFLHTPLCSFQSPTFTIRESEGFGKVRPQRNVMLQHQEKGWLALTLIFFFTECGWGKTLRYVWKHALHSSRGDITPSTHASNSEQLIVFFHQKSADVPILRLSVLMPYPPSEPTKAFSGEKDQKYAFHWEEITYLLIAIKHDA